MSRIQIELTEPRVKELEELMSRQGIATKKDLLNRALTLYEWYSKEVDNGHEIASIDKERNSYKVLVMPG
jgi:hypothetical protein